MLAGLAAPAPAHLVFGSRTLWQLVSDADLVAHARIEGAEEVIALEGTPERRPVVRARLLEVWKGEVPAGALRFAQHGHGTAEFAPGDEALVFLRRIERVAELDELGRRTGLAWVSLQEHDERWALDGATGAAVASAVRGYAAAGELPDPAQRVAALREATLALLGSPDERLASSALRDAVGLPQASLLRREDLPAVEPLLERRSVPIGIRVGLLAELARRGLVEGGPRWLRLLRETAGAERLEVIRAAGAQAGPEVTAELVGLLASPESETTEAAALALGAPGRASAVAPLAAALGRSEARVRMAAIRGLGAVATPEARAPLEAAAARHPDPATRRRAAAEAALLARRAPPAPTKPQ